MAIYELDPVDTIAVAAVGEPGQRRFFLLASGSGRTLTLSCEKSQIQALIVRLHQMLEAQQIETSEAPIPMASEPEPVPGDPEWQSGEMGLGYHDARQTWRLGPRQAAPGAQPQQAPTADDAP